MNFTINLLTPLVILFAMNLSIYRVLRKLRLSGTISGNDQNNRRPSCSVFLRNCVSKYSSSFQSVAASDVKNNLSLRLGTTDNIEERPRELNFVGVSDAHTREDCERDASYTRASILMVVGFVLCHTPRLITNTLELFIDQDNLPAVSIFRSANICEISALC